MTRDLAIVIACYGQPQMMAKQEQHWDSFPEELARRIEIVIVDDHGDPAYEFTPRECVYGISVYRVDKDIPWNQMGARNLGMKKATAPWRLMLDPDMLVSADCLAKIFAHFHKFKKGVHYKPKLMPLRDPYGSPNLYVCHVDDFWKAGGYNEDFAGAKGYSDVVLHRTLADVSVRKHFQDVVIEFVSNKQIPDADVRTLSRDLTRNKVKFRQAVQFAQRNSWKLYGQGVANHVRFPWHRVS